MVYIGTILEIENNKTYVFTMDCGLVSVKTKKDYFVGKQISFTKKDKIFNFFQNKTVIMRSVIAFAAVFAIILSTVLIRPFFEHDIKLDGTSVAIVSVDINPSIEFNVNKDKLIISATAINDDGQKVLDTLDLKGIPLKDGVDKVVATAKKMGYIAEGKKIVLVSATMDPNSKLTSDDYTNQLKNILTSLEKDGADTNVMSVFIEDPEIIDLATQNNLSIGREFLYKYALMQNGNLTADDIRKGTLTDLLNKLNALQQNGKLGEDIKKQAGDSATNPVPTDFNANVTANPVNGGIEIKWTKGPDAEGFNYYKIVASKANSTPEYPADGYAMVITNKDVTSAVVNANSNYYNGDVGGKLLPGESYYFSVSYVYNGSVFRGNAVKATMPIDKPAETQAPATTTTKAPVVTKAPDKFNPQMSLNTNDGNLNFSWPPVGNSVNYNGKTYSGFSFYKVVASKNNPNPIYSEDGYAKAISDCNTRTAVISPNSKYSNGDFGGMIVGGETYYFSITYVFENGKFTVTNPTRAKVPGSAPEPEKPPQVDTPSSDFKLNITPSGKTLNFSWTPVSSPFNYGGRTYNNFAYYKVVASETVSAPKYPENGWVIYLGEPNWSVDATTFNFEKTKLIPGHTYHFGITYVFEDGKLYSEVKTVTVPS